MLTPPQLATANDTYYSPEAKHSFGRIMEIVYGANTGVHAYNSDESESISIKYGALCKHCWGLAVTDFGRYTRTNDSLRGS